MVGTARWPSVDGPGGRAPPNSSDQGIDLLFRAF